MNYHIAVDIGGTRIRSACYPVDSNKPIAVERISTRGINPALDRVCQVIEKTWPGNGVVCGISLAAPGPVDPFQGIVLYAPNVQGWKNIDLKKHLSSCFNTPVIVGNDANLAAIGEWKYGAGKGHHHLVYLTISTGIGGGVIVNDQLLLGVRGMAGELGHVTLLPGGPVCGCGKNGHLEALASGTAIAQWVQNEIANGRSSTLAGKGEITSLMVHQAALEGDGLAKEAFNRAGYYLGMALANFIHIFNPTMIILGGGVSKSGEFLLKPIRDSIAQYIIDPHYLENFNLVVAQLGDDAGLLGALTLAREAFPG
jgi:glucokinase